MQILKHSLRISAIVSLLVLSGYSNVKAEENPFSCEYRQFAITGTHIVYAISCDIGDKWIGRGIEGAGQIDIRLSNGYTEITGQCTINLEECVDMTLTGYYV